MQEEDAADIAELIFNSYPTMTPEDLTVFWKSCKTLKVKTPKQTIKLTNYGNFSPSKITNWLEEFQEAVTDSIEHHNQTSSEGHNNLQTFLRSNIGTQVMEHFVSANEAHRRAEEKRKKEEIEISAKKLDRFRGAVLENFYREANMHDLELRGLTSRDMKSISLNMVKYWDVTPPEQQAKEWAPILYNDTLQGDNESMYYMLGGDWKNPMYKFIEGEIKAHDESAIAKVKEEAKKRWVNRLKLIGHEPKGKNAREIIKSCNPEIMIPKPGDYYLMEVVCYYMNNIYDSEAL